MGIHQSIAQPDLGAGVAIHADQDGTRRLVEAQLVDDDRAFQQHPIAVEQIGIFPIGASRYRSKACAES